MVELVIAQIDSHIENLEIEEAYQLAESFEILEGITLNINRKV